MIPVLTRKQAVNFDEEIYAMIHRSVVLFFATPHRPGPGDEERDMVDEMVKAGKPGHDAMTFEASGANFAYKKKKCQPHEACRFHLSSRRPSGP